MECGNQFKDFLNKKCVDKCPNQLPYINDGACIKKCQKFYYEDENGNKFCTKNCDNKLIFLEENKCLSNCNDNVSYKLHGYNICYSTCNDNSLIPRYNYLTKDIFSKCIENCIERDNTKEEKECITECLRPFKFRIKDDDQNKECYQSCNDLNKCEYVDEKKNNFCVDNCKKFNKILYDNKCIDKCPKESQIKVEKDGEFICDVKCNKKYLIEDNEKNNGFFCANFCKEINYVLDDNRCLKVCSPERPFVIYEENENKCSEKCEKGKYENYNSINGIYECVDSCININKFINGEKCAGDCPPTKHFKIMKDNGIICSFSCDKEYIYLNEENNNKYCVKSCKEFLKVVYNGKCVNKCPNDIQ